MARETRSKYPGSFGWEEQIHFVLVRDYGFNRRPSPDQLHPYAAAGLTVGDAAKRFAAAHGLTRTPAPQPPATPRPAGEAPKQPTLFD